MLALDVNFEHVDKKRDHNYYYLITVSLVLFLDKFVNDVLPSHIDVSISKTVAAGKYKLSEEEITYVNIIKGHFHVFLTSFSKRVLVLILSYENEISFTCKLSSFSYQWLCTRPHFNGEA